MLCASVQRLCQTVQIAALQSSSFEEAFRNPYKRNRMNNLFLRTSQEAGVHAEFTKDPQLSFIILVANLPPAYDANRSGNANA
jgi:hypothetical protein